MAKVRNTTRLKAHVEKCVYEQLYRGFESHSLRHCFNLLQNFLSYEKWFGLTVVTIGDEFYQLEPRSLKVFSFNF